MMFRPGNIGHLGRLGLIAGSQPSLVTQALAILAKYGSAANLFIPGVGAISGITAGNWVNSTGDTAASVDSAVGLVLGAAKAVGSELVVNGDFSSSSSWSSSADPGGSSVISGGVATLTNTTGTARLSQSLPLVAGRVYRLTVNVSGASITCYSGSSEAVGTLPVGSVTRFFTATASSNQIGFRNFANGTSVVLDNVSVVEMTGAHLTQSTSGNRPVLRQSYGVYSWQFDGTNDHFVTTLATPDTGYYVGGALCTNTGATHTIGGGSGAWADDSAGVWVARQSNGNIRVSVGNGTTRNNFLSQVSPINSAFVASAGWNLSNLFTGVNNTEVAISNSINCSTSRPIYVGTTVGTAPTSLISPMIGNLYAQIWILGFTPTAAERATLRQFVASLSGVTL